MIKRALEHILQGLKDDYIDTKEATDLIESLYNTNKYIVFNIDPRCTSVSSMYNIKIIGMR